jgi:proton-translocating NADH-quinone oxidoreductase chain M
VLNKKNIEFVKVIGSFLSSFLDYLTPQFIGIVAALINFYHSLFLWFEYDNTATVVQCVNFVAWMPFHKMHFHLGVDGISIFFIILTTFLIPICLLASWQSIQKNVVFYVVLFLILESFLILVFSILDVLLFYVSFESVLIPMFLIIGIWGSRERKIKAGYYFFLYTLFGSVFMLLGIMYMYSATTSTTYFNLLNTFFDLETQKLLFIAFFIAFAAKIPMFPMHIWLPEAHVEAPTAGSVLLAGILLKLGGYGFLRFSIAMFPEASKYFAPFVLTLSVLGILYASLTTLRQIDLKRIIAYSSVAHMNMVMVGLFSDNLQGVEGAIFLMLGHGIVSSALFLIVGVLYDRHHTRLLMYYGGVTQIMPVFSIFFLAFTLGNIALPGTSNFVGEFLVLAGIIQQSFTLTFFSALSMVLGAAYSLWLYNRVAFGELKIQYIKEYIDVTRREFYILTPLLFLMIFLGIYPEIFFTEMHASVNHVILNIKL